LALWLVGQPCTAAGDSGCERKNNMTGGELEPLIGLWNTIVFVLTADWNALKPFIERILTIFFYVFGMVFMWKWLKKK
jgi:hypothetical protein